MEDVAVFGFEEHESQFFLDPQHFKSASAEADRYLLVDLGTVAVEVMAASGAGG